MNGAKMHTNTNSLLKAVHEGRLRLTRLLLEGGAYINESNEHGETPLMIACKSRYADNQGVPKAKMVAYLLESGADPDIQDKSGKTALMHACQAQAEPEVVSILLGHGADPGLEDHAGWSTLIHAINANDEGTLKLIVDAFKARGKEVVIVATDRLDDGRLTAKQYLKVPTMAEVDHWQPSWVPCASPSEIHLSTSPQATHPSSPMEHTFSFQDVQTASSSQPLVNKRVNKVHLQRLHSEPWLKIPQSFLAQHQAKSNSGVEELHNKTPQDEPPGTDLKQPTRSSQTRLHHASDGGLRPDEALSCNLSFDGLSSPYSHSHPNLHSKLSAEFPTAEKAFPNLAVSSLCNIIRRRKLGMDHYSSDSQLSVSGNSTGNAQKQLPKKQLATSRSSTLLSSQESPERQAVSPDRKGSEALLTDPPSNPRFLPPLNRVPNVQPAGANGYSANNKSSCGAMTGIKQYLPSAPAGLPKDLKIRRMLMRRHSMQPEQIKQLGEFTHQ